MCLSLYLVGLVCFALFVVFGMFVFVFGLFVSFNAFGMFGMFGLIDIARNQGPGLLNLDPTLMRKKRGVYLIKHLQV